MPVTALLSVVARVIKPRFRRAQKLPGANLDKKPNEEIAIPKSDENVLDWSKKSAEARLKKEQMMMAAIVESSEDAIIGGTLDGFVTSWNPAAQRIFGYPVQEIVGQSVLALFPHGRHAELETFHSAVRKGKSVRQFHTERIRKNGERIDVSLTVSPIRDEEGVIIGASSIVRDITERKAAERERNRTNAILKTSSDGIHILDSDGTLVEANDAFLNMLGYDRSVIGKLHITDWQTHRSGAAIIAEIHDLIRQNGQKIIETRHRRSDGALIDVEINMSASEIDDKGYLYAASRDITGRKQTEQALRLAATVFESQEGMVITDAGGAILQVNRAFTKIAGYTQEDIVGQNPRRLKSGHHDVAFYREMWACINHSGGWQGEIRNRRKNGEVYLEWLVITAVKNNQGLVTHYVGTFTDITSHKTAEDEIKNLAFYDPLTRLPNRRLLLDRLQHAMASSNRSEKYGALLLLDLDNFKSLNDTLGHEVGDQLLQQVSARLVSCVRQGDTVARLGGDEFVVMLEGLSGNPDEAASQVEALGGKILATLDKAYQLAGFVHHCSASIGATLFLDHLDSTDALLQRSDLAMYRAKGAGRNTLCFFDQEMQALVMRRVALEAELRDAILKGQLHVHYQAQVDGNRFVTGAEALLRWQHPLRGPVSPSEFIPIAEETGLILSLGSWVLQTACTQLALWATLPEMAHLTIAVNVSARQFRHKDFVGEVMSMLNRTGANPKKLKLELTEGMLLDNVDDTIVKMTKLRKEGIRFSLDDFGTGYSSLSYLKRLPLDQLKIDQSFVRDILTDPNDCGIVRTVIALGKNLGLTVIAEGVETETQRSFLNENGCLAYQGHLFGHPLPIEGFEQLVNRDNTNKLPASADYVI
ncbi:putative Diguanylate cyclase [Georgfuchsia toluolica]|uniref:Diguanylate cyclase n=1 Tax=Georgfuchsia toluolica TaxID=424218 RepID=A0A916JAB2_9PROT|nr:putative Diguanylate cyclase [Georgfuchsia toluolica]